MYPLTLNTEIQAANRALARLIYLSFSLPEVTYTHRVHRQIQPFLRQYPSLPCPFTYRAYTFAVQKHTRKVQTWFLNGLPGPRHFTELPERVTGVRSRQSDEWRLFLASHALVRRIVAEDCENI